MEAIRVKNYEDFVLYSFIDNLDKEHCFFSDSGKTYFSQLLYTIQPNTWTHTITLIGDNIRLIILRKRQYTCENWNYDWLCEELKKNVLTNKKAQFDFSIKNFINKYFAIKQEQIKNFVIMTNGV